MAYVRLPLPDTKVNAAISMATERHLEQAHHLLSATYPSANGPQIHFGTSAAVMTLLAIAATSAIQHFDPKVNKKRGGDRAAFTACVLRFFPWHHVTIADDQHRPVNELPKLAADELYDVFRNPLVHSGGVTGRAHLSGTIAKWHRTPNITHVFPGLSPKENEQAMEQYCNATLSGDRFIELEAFSSTVHTRPLYWCTRKMIEAFAADAGVQADIAKNLGI
jgi:hypothetical protein